MELIQASRKKAKIKMALQGPSGAGKTMSALLIAYGLCGSWEKIAVIDTENHSADLYAHLGPYKTLSLEPPYSPERYVVAFDTCVRAMMEVVIIDSSSHEWDFLLDYHSTLQGNSFANWAKVTPRHEAFVNSILQASIHVICTIRSKQDYILTEKNGKQVPEKVGMKGVQRESLEYEFTLVFEIDMTQRAKPSKDRTSMFMGKPDFVPTIETGKQILAWCELGAEQPFVTLEQVLAKIQQCKTEKELLDLYNEHPIYQKVLHADFAKMRQSILIPNNQNQPHPNGAVNGQRQ